MVDQKSTTSAYAASPFSSTNTPAFPASRIDVEVERLRALLGLMLNTHERIMRHAHSLGFYNEPMTAQNTAITSPPTNLRDAIDQLEGAASFVSGSLNVFD